MDETPLIDDTVFEEKPLLDESLYTPELKGTGNILTDYYLSQRMAMLDPSMGDYLDRVQKTADYIQTLDNEQINQVISDTLAASKARLQDFRLGLAALDQVVYPATLSPTEQEELVKGNPESANPYEEVAAMALEYMKQFPVGSADWVNVRTSTLALMVHMRAQELGINTDPTLGDSFGTMVPLRNMWDLGFGGDFESKVSRFNNLTVDKQFREFVNIVDGVFKGTDNNILRKERIAPFINPSDIEAVKEAIAFDAFDAATLIPATKILKLAKHSHTPLKFMRGAGKNKEAGEALNSATKSERAANAAGMTKEDAVLSTSPFTSEGIDPRLVEGLSAEVQKQISDEVAALLKDLQPLHDDTILKNKIWTPEEVQKANAKFRSKFANAVRPVQVTEEGTIWEVAVVKQEDVLRTPDTLSNRVEFLKSQLVRMTDIDLPEMMAAGMKAEAKDLKKEIILTKKEIGVLEDIRRLDIERDSLVTRLNIAKANSDAPELSAEIKSITEDLVRVKQKRARSIQQLRTRTVETQDYEQKFVMFTEDDFGQLQATEIPTGTSRFFNAPSTYIAGMQQGLVSTARNIGFQQEMIRNVFQKAYKGTLENLSRQEKKKLDSILVQGDESGVVYSASDLAEGIRTPDGLIKLDSQEQITAYYKMRRLADDLKVINDRIVKRKLELQNFKAVQLPDGVGFIQPGNALPAIPANVKRIYDMSSGKIRGRKRLLNGEAVYRLRKPISTGKEEINYVIARESDFQPIPDHPLEYRPGYIPRIREGIQFIGELVGKAMIDGVEVAGHAKTVRFFDNPVDAETWTKSMQSKGAAVQVKSANQWFSENPGRIDNWEEQAFGGTFEGSRTDGKIPFNLDESEAARMGGIESLEAYMNHLSNRIPATDFRVALVRRFINSAVDPVTGKSVLNASGDWRDPLNLDKNSKLYAGLKGMQDWVKAQLSVPTTDERKWNQVAHNIARTYTNIPLVPAKKAVSKAIVAAGTKDLSAIARTSAFHITLGFMNPAQFIVQAMGFTTALAIDPLGAPRNLARYLAMRAALSVPKRNIALEIKAAKAAGEDVTEFQEMMYAYHRAGLHQSIESVGDYGHATGMYASRASLGYLADKSLFFFREGERFVRGYAWIQAWKKMYRKGMKVTDEFINDVTNESVRYTLDLNRANRAYWQTGALGIPTQFMQITTKFMENYLYSGSKLEAGWTAAEKVRISLAHMAMFGAAGIPFGNAMLNSALAWVKDEGDFGLAIKDDATAVALSGGLAELAMFLPTGEHVSFSDRVSIPQGIEQFFDRLFDKDATALEIMAGVFGEVPKRSVQALGHLTHLYGSILVEDAPVDIRVLLETGNELANITSGYRNMRKSFMWERENAILTSRGDKILPLDERNRMSVLLAQALSLSPEDIENFYQIRKYNQDAEEDIRESVDAWVQTVRRYSNSPVLMSASGSERVRAMLRFTVRDLTQDQRIEVARRVSKKLAEDDYKLTKELMEALENAMMREGDLGSLETNTLLIPSK